MSPIGRPKADKPKDVRYSIQLEAKTEQRLQAYCEAHGITKGNSEKNIQR